MRGAGASLSTRSVTPDEEELLRRLAISDETALVTAVLGKSRLGLDRKTWALVRVAALIAVDSAVASYQWAIDEAIAQGATEEEVIDVLLAIAPVVGVGRVTSAAPELALALGYDVAHPDPPR
jgi:alkylhydroperoxidase/carboxymuconolactone decarboxylase family protein YurZ